MSYSTTKETKARRQSAPVTATLAKSNPPRRPRRLATSLTTRRRSDGAAVNYVSYVSYVVNSGIFLRAFVRFVVGSSLYFPPPISRIAPVAYEASLDSSQRIARAI